MYLMGIKCKGFLFACSEGFCLHLVVHHNHIMHSTSGSIYNIIVVFKEVMHYSSCESLLIHHMILCVQTGAHIGKYLSCSDKVYMITMRMPGICVSITQGFCFVVMMIPYLGT